MLLGSPATLTDVDARWKCQPRTVLDAIYAGRLKAFPLRPEARRLTWRILASAVSDFESGHHCAPVKPTRRNGDDDFVEYF